MLCESKKSGRRYVPSLLQRLEKDYKNFMRRVNIEELKDCWVWTGARDASGYGSFHMCARGQVPAHRAAWEFNFGPIPPGLLVCHTCDNPPCVNPAHLFLGTYSDNMQDCISKGRHVTLSRRKGNIRP